VGVLGRGPYALATAALLPEAITSVCVFASLGPYRAPGLDFTEGMSEGFREEIGVLIDDPGWARADFRTRSAEFARLSSSPAWWMDKWGDRAGKDAAHSQEWADYLALVNRDGYTGGDEGWWEDWSASSLPWGFDIASIQAPVALWHTGCATPQRRQAIPAGSPTTSRTPPHTSPAIKTTPTLRRTTAARPSPGCAGTCSAPPVSDR